MQGLPFALLAATGLTGLLAFGVIQSAFTQQAQALFYVFCAAMLVIFASKKLGGGGGGHAKGGHGGGGATLFSGRLVGTLMLASAVLGVGYFWTDNELTGEKLGREIDRGVQAAGEAVATLMRDDDASARD